VVKYFYVIRFVCKKTVVFEMLILIQFLLRATFGMAAAMAYTSPKEVTSGYYRNHLYVLLGFNVLASLVAYSHRAECALWPPIAAVALCYVGAVCWLYEKPRLGILALIEVAATSLVGLTISKFQSGDVATSESGTPGMPLKKLLQYLDPISGGLVLGVTLAAMFLGHWYLNTPTMKMAPLKKLVLGMGIALVLRAVVCGTGLVLTFQYADPHQLSMWFVLMRWLAGIVGAMGVVWMTWETLKIPNTQSATGILYVGVIVTFIGELASVLMSSTLPYPI
jgi:hypothetical protein